MNREEFQRDVIEQVLNLSIVDVISKYMDLPKRVGNNELGICPFHNDTKLGSFIVNEKKGMFKCFACGKGGDAINFVRLECGLNYIEAVFEIAINNNIIMACEYEEYFKGKIPEKRKNNPATIKKKEMVNNIANDETLDLVFNILLDKLELLSLHRQHLNDVREIKDEIIEERKYKTFPKYEESRRIVDKLVKELLCSYSEEDVEKILSGIPGFFKEKILGSWKWHLAYRDGLVIPIRNVGGQIVGIQTRKDKKDESKGRYKWFSSSFAINDESRIQGTGSGAPLDIVYPKGVPNNVLFITEGRFKAEVIAERIGSAVISVQGVGSYRGVEDAIGKIEENIKGGNKEWKGFSRIYVAYDNDFLSNRQIYNQMKDMTDKIAETHDKEIFYICNTTEHKGIDDLIIHNGAKTPQEIENFINICDKDEFDINYKNKEEFINSIKTKMPKEVRKQIMDEEEFSKAVEEQFEKNSDFISNACCNFKFNIEKIKEEIRRTKDEIVEIEDEILMITGYEKIGLTEARKIKADRPELTSVIKEYNSFRSRLERLQGILRAEDYNKYHINAVDKTYFKGFSFPSGATKDVLNIIEGPSLKVSYKKDTEVNWELITEVYLLNGEKDRQRIKEIELILTYLEEITEISGLNLEYVFLGNKAYIKRIKPKIDIEKKEIEKRMKVLNKAEILIQERLAKMNRIEDKKESVIIEYIPF